MSMPEPVGRRRATTAQATGEQYPASINTSIQPIEFDGAGLPNAMSVDVEDYFQVSAFENHIDRKVWESIPSRIPGNIDRILQLFNDHGTTATFFILGWVGRNQPSVVRQIAAAGHEIASHGNDHRRVTSLDPEKLLMDVSDTRKLLEDISGLPVTGYRAPSFSISEETLWAYRVLEEAGYLYSSSVFPISHDHYGLPGAPRYPFRVDGCGLLEIPMSTVRLGGRNLPCAGGGYFRLLPLVYSRWAISRINNSEHKPAVFYFHPWEMDPDQPRVPGIPVRTRFRHYVNLGAFERRLARILSSYRWRPMSQVYGKFF